MTATATVETIDARLCCSSLMVRAAHSLVYMTGKQMHGGYCTPADCARLIGRCIEREALNAKLASRAMYRHGHTVTQAECRSFVHHTLSVASGLQGQVAPAQRDDVVHAVRHHRVGLEVCRLKVALDPAFGIAVEHDDSRFGKVGGYTQRIHEGVKAKSRAFCAAQAFKVLQCRADCDLLRQGVQVR